MITNAEGLVLANVLQQDLDHPLDVPSSRRFWPQPTAVRRRGQPKA